MNCVNDKELNEYIDRVIGTLSEDQLSELEQSPYPYVVKIQEKVKSAIETMTGLEVSDVNIRIAGVEMDK